jgi:hypothetical protein
LPFKFNLQRYTGGASEILSVRALTPADLPALNGAFAAVGLCRFESS